MTAPRRHIPGQVVMLTRRTVDRRFFLRPDSTINQIVMYELAKASTAHDVPVSALMVQSNHPHVGAADPHAQRSLFMRDFCSGVARARNQDIRRNGRFWDNQQYGDCILLDRDAIERFLVYIWTNPSKDDLVRKAEDWPGAKILPRDWGKPMVVRRPKTKFYENSNQPEFIVFTPMPPPGFEDLTLEEAKAHFEGLLRAEEERLAKKRRRAGRRVRGRIKILNRDVNDVPKTPSKRGELNPRFASKDNELMQRAEKAWNSFRRVYAVCRRRWKAGDRDVEFPAGTLKLRMLAPIRCRAPDPSEPTVL